MAGKRRAPTSTLPSFSHSSRNITPTKPTLSLSTEATRDWENEVWSVPINVVVSQLLKIGPQIIQAAVGGRYWAESPDGGPQNWGARVQLTLLFPK